MHALVNEKFYHGYSSFTTLFACSSNAILIYSILASNVKHVGPYRLLLLGFAVTEITISLVHFALIPCIHLTEFGCIFWGYRLLKLTTEQAVWACMVWIVLFYQTFVLTSFHYVYRFVIMCNPPWLYKIQRNPWRNWITIAVVYDVLFVGTICIDGYVGFHPDLYRKEFAPIMMNNYGINLMSPEKPGFLGIVYWIRSVDGSKQWVAKSLISILAIIMVFSTSVFTLVFCLTRILRELSPNPLHFNSATRHMQRQLFRALLWQTIIPLITSYFPIAFLFVAPLLTGVEWGGLGTLILMSTQIFPMLDPFIMLFFVQGYRRSLPKFIHKIVYGTTGISLGNRSNSVSMVLK